MENKRTNTRFVMDFHVTRNNHGSRKNYCSVKIVSLNSLFFFLTFFFFLLFLGLKITFKIICSDSQSDWICFFALFPRVELEKREIETAWHHTSLKETQAVTDLLPGHEKGWKAIQPQNKGHEQINPIPSTSHLKHHTRLQWLMLIRANVIKSPSTPSPCPFPQQGFSRTFCNLYNIQNRDGHNTEDKERSQ